MSGLRESRTWRKFVRHRPAIVALIVIAAYLLTALVLLLTGWVTLDSTTERVGPKLLPGFGLMPAPQERMENAEWLIDRIESLANRSNSEAALQDFNDLGSRRIVIQQVGIKAALRPFGQFFAL